MARAWRSSRLVVAVTLGGCGLLEIGTPEAIDARGVDAAEPDAVVELVDAPIDTPRDCCVAPTHAGTLDVYEAKVLDPGGAGTFYGQGIVARLRFISSELAAPVLDEQPGAPTGCKAWSLTPAQAAVAVPGLDEGALLIRSPAGGAPLLPTCVYVPGGYRCADPLTDSAGGTIAAGVGPFAGAAVLSDADVTYTAANTDDRYLEISGATNAANNGRFPIIGRVDATTIAFVNPAFVAEVLPMPARHANVAGIGPIPGVPDPGFLANDATADIFHAGGGGGHIPPFTATVPAGSVGDSFTLAPAELARLNAIPRDGTAFAIACAAADCPAGSANLTQLEVVATDGPTGGLAPFAMPAPTARLVVVRCNAVGATSVTVPADYAALIASSGATRIRATFLRANIMLTGVANVTALIGHAIVGYSD